jgi:DNA-binding Xre family transcriptional regulator
MITIKLREVAGKIGIENAYQLQKKTGFHISTAYSLWEESWQKTDLETLNTLCNVLRCTPNDLLEFHPDEELTDV